MKFPRLPSLSNPASKLVCLVLVREKQRGEDKGERVVDYVVGDEGNSFQTDGKGLKMQIRG